MGGRDSRRGESGEGPSARGSARGFGSASQGRGESWGVTRTVAASGPVAVQRRGHGPHLQPVRGGGSGLPPGLVGTVS